MDRTELKARLDLLQVDPKQYSLTGEFTPDAIVLFQNYSKWEVFYVDERGGKHDERIFASESEACRHIYKKFSDAKEIEKKYNLNT